MRQLPPDIRRRYFKKPDAPSPERPRVPGRDPPAAEGASQQKAATAMMCPDPLCDTELVILPEQEGQWVECPTCGFRFLAPRPGMPVTVFETEPIWMRTAPDDTEIAGALAALVKSTREPDDSFAPPEADEISDSAMLAGGLAEVQELFGPVKPPPSPADGFADLAPPIPVLAGFAAPPAGPLVGGPPAAEAAGPKVEGAVDLTPPGTLKPGFAEAPADSRPVVRAPSPAGRPKDLLAKPAAPAKPADGFPFAAPARRGAALPAVGVPVRPAAAEPADDFPFAGPARRGAALPAVGVPVRPAAARIDLGFALPPRPKAVGFAGPSAMPAATWTQVRRANRSDLALTWVVALVVAGGIVAAAAVSEIPELGLGSLIFIGLAVGRTVMALRRRQPRVV